MNIFLAMILISRLCQAIIHVEIYLPKDVRENRATHCFCVQLIEIKIN